MDSTFTYIFIPQLSFHGHLVYYRKPIMEEMVLATEFNEHNAYFYKTAETIRPLGKYIGQQRVASPYAYCDGDFVYHQFECGEITESNRSNVYSVAIATLYDNMMRIDNMQYGSYDVYYRAQ